MLLDEALPRPHNLLGAVYLWQKQYDQAVAEGEQAIALDPNDAVSYVNLGGILSLAGRPEEAIGLIEKAMRLNPNISLEMFRQGLPYKDHSVLDHHLEALRRAGLK